MSKIDYFTPNKKMFEVVEQYNIAFNNANIPTEQRVSHILNTFYDNAKSMKEKGIDFWLSFGVYLPAVERVISRQNGESEAEFYRRTQYALDIVDAYTVVNRDEQYDDFATLVCADLYKNEHLKSVPVNTTRWQLNTDGDMLDLVLFENRLRGV